MQLMPFTCDDFGKGDIVAFVPYYNYGHADDKQKRLGIVYEQGGKFLHVLTRFDSSLYRHGLVEGYVLQIITYDRIVSKIVA